MSLELSMALGMGFGVLAALLAFVITVEACRRQQLPTALIWRESLTAAAFAFAVFLVASIALGYGLRWVI